MREIPHIIETLEKEATIQNKLLELLSERLQPVLRATDPSSNAKVSEECCYSCTVASTLQNIHFQMKRSNSFVQRLIDAVEL